MLVIVSCQETQVWQEIEIGKTVKISSEKFKSDNSNYIFNWSKPIGEDLGIEYIIQNDKILIKAKKIGEYKIDLVVENLSNTIIHNESFYINAIPNSEPIIQPSKNENNIDTKVEVFKNEKQIIEDRKDTYTIQVASWPKLSQAIEDKNNLISLGYDSYIEKYSNKEKNISRWRVRIGSFENRTLAIQIKEDLAKFRGDDIWIDKIK